MTGKSHTALAACTGLAVCALFPDFGKPIYLGASLIISSMAGTLPDIDVGASKKIYKYSVIGLIGLSFILAIALIVSNLGMGIINSLPLNIVGCIIFALICIFSKKQPHRGFTHSFLALLVYAVSVSFIINGIPPFMYKIILISFVSGYLSHIAIDLLNKKGEQLLFPMSNRWCLKLCSSNGVANEIVFGSSIFGVVVLLVYLILR